MSTLLEAPSRNCTRIAVFGVLKGRKAFIIDGSLGQHSHARHQILPRIQHLQPATRVQFRLGALLQHFANPTPLFEHEDEHEHEDDFDAPGEGEYFLDRYLGLKPQAQSFHPRPQRSRSDAGWAFGINPSSPFGSDSRFLPRRPSYPAR